MNNYSQTIKKTGTLLLVAAIMLQASVAPVAADPGDAATGAECSLRGSAGFWGGFLGIDVKQCQTPAETVAQTHADTYTQGLSAFDKQKLSTTNYQNQLNHSRNTCLCKVKADVIEALQNGTSKTAAKDKVNETIDSHYAAIQHNVIQSHASQTSELYYVMATIQNGELYQTMWTDNDGGSDYGLNYQIDSSETFGTVNRTVNLVDGNTTEINAVYVHDNGASTTFNPFNSSLSSADRDESLWMFEPGKTYANYDNNAENADYLYHEQSWANVWDAIQDEHDYVTNNSMQYVEDVYANYNASDFSDTDAQELHSACSLNTLGTDTDSTGSLSWARAAAATAGYDTNVNNSFVVTYTPASGETFVGDTSVTASTPDLNMTSVSIGANAIVTGTESFSVDLDGTNISSPQLVLHSTADDSVITSVPLTDGNADGTYNGALTAGNYSTLTNGDTVTASVEATASGTATRIDIGTWTYAPNGGASVELDGALYTDWAPAVTNSSFTVNQTYDTANAGGESVIFLDSDGVNKGYHTLDGTFTINSMYNPTTGESVNSTTLEDYNTQTTDASLTLEEVEKILDYRQQYRDNWNPTVTIGGGDGLFSGLGDALGVGGIIIVVVIGGAIYLYLQQNGGGGGGSGDTYVVTSGKGRGGNK
ncbi:hypothetical protein [Haloarchaeobius litoreus]|uniref:Envelope protein N-terminal domain-containing protein n=1 Tax=Haloarchaeobius litoreus TaxID=755306 RepID=A0ABD6DJZ1_9EURY|nr:hypothetical protein [Haloarchaeobius litoreus]